MNAHLFRHPERSEGVHKRATGLSSSFWLALVLIAFFSKVAAAQVGNNNPTGPAGIFNGDITTGGDYDPLTASVRRAVTDIVVNGSVQPLALVRTATSRGLAYRTNAFGYAGNWNHNYEWSLYGGDDSRTSNLPPAYYSVSFPDGRTETFIHSASDIYFRAGTGVRERFIPMAPPGNMLSYLVLSDGSKVEFKATQITYKDFADPNCTDSCGPLVNWYYYSHVPQAVIDPYGLRTTLTYNADGTLYEVKEPGGRWLHFFYITTTWGIHERVIDHVSASDGRTVQYNYAYGAFSPGVASYTYLASVNYYGDGALNANYTYQAPNVPNYPIGGNYNGVPLLKTCVDAMYGGPMWKIAYVYATTNNPDGTSAAVGQIKSENYFDGTNAGAAVSTLEVTSATSRKETRGDTPSRTFTYNTSGFLTSCTDFKNVAASQAYDTNSYVNAVTDRNGHTSNFTLNALTGNPTQVQVPAAADVTPSPAPRGTVNYVYGSSSCADPNNRDGNNPYYLYSVQDEGGNITTYSRDTNKRVTQITYPDSGYETFSYNSFGQVLTHRLTTSGTENFNYNSTGQKTVWYDSYHTATAPNAWYLYDSQGRLQSVTDALGAGAGDVNHTITYAYNNRNQVTTVTHPTDPVDGTRHTLVNNIRLSDGTLTSVTDELGHLTSYTYDDYRRVLTTTTPLRYVGDPLPHTTYGDYTRWGTSSSYLHTASFVFKFNAADGQETDIDCDNNLKKAIIRQAPNTADDAWTYLTYDNAGNLTQVKDPKGNITITAYDERNRPMSVTDPKTNVTSFKYDQAGRKASVTRANGQVVTFDSYDQRNRLLQQTAKQSPDPDAVTKYTYYQSGLIQTMKDPRLVATSSTYSYAYTYDLMGRETQLTYPPDSYGAQTTEKWHYDTANRNDTFTNRLGTVETMTYDALYRETQASWNDSGTTPTVNFTFDAAGRMLTVTNTNATITRAYYNDNLLNTETTRYADVTNRTLTYTYDADGRRASVQYPSGAYTFNYAYTQRGQLDTIVSGATTVANYDYDVNGNLTTRALSNGTSSTYGYDTLNRTTGITNNFSAGSTAPLARTLGYDYDSVGNRKFTKRDGGMGDVFGYDQADQVEAVKLNVANPDTTGAGAQTIVYDANGNRTSFSAYGPTDTYTITNNSLNQYTKRNTVTAIYDHKGNVQTGFDGSTYTYDAQSRVRTAAKGATTDTFTYDGLNRQVTRKIGSASPIYNVYDGWDLIGEYNANATSPTNAYLYGASGIVKGMSSSSSWYYYQDASGCTSHLANNLGQLVEAYRYDLQGTPIFLNASGGTIPSSLWGIRHLFTGQQWYSEIGLYDLRNRFYSPDMGRLLQSDPASFGGDATNLYRYCGNNPLRWSDPSGLGFWDFLPKLWDALSSVGSALIGAGGNAERVTINGSFSQYGEPNPDGGTTSTPGNFPNIPPALGIGFPNLLVLPGNFSLVPTTGFGLALFHVAPKPILPAVNPVTPFLGSQPTDPLSAFDPLANIADATDSSSFGLTTAAIGAGLWASGQPIIPYQAIHPGAITPAGSVGATSPASVFFRSVIPGDFPQGVRIFGTNSIGGALARATPWVGVAMIDAGIGFWATSQPAWQETNRINVEVTGQSLFYGPKF